jgi:hypothetical protein
MRNNLTICELVSSGERLQELASDRRLENVCPSYVTSKLMLVTYERKTDFVSAHARYNIVLSLFTTAAARLKLYEYMDTIVSTPGCRLLYTDTDSVFFLYPRTQGCPIQCGALLGEMSNQYPDHEILAYYSTGSKSYALKMQHKRTRKIDHIVKCKGITLNQETVNIVSFARFKVYFLFDYVGILAGYMGIVFRRW